MKKRIPLLVLASVLAVGLAGCTTDTTTDSTNSSTTTAYACYKRPGDSGLSDLTADTATTLPEGTFIYLYKYKGTSYTGTVNYTVTYADGYSGSMSTSGTLTFFQSFTLDGSATFTLTD